MTEQPFTATIPRELAGLRLDQALAKLFPAYSRACLQAWIRQGRTLVDQQQRPPKHRVRGGEQVTLQPGVPDAGPWVAEPIGIAIVYEDEDLLVVNKQAGLVVHPGAGNPAGTLVNALLHHEPRLSALPRAGIVHRLDKDTSGLLVVARTLSAHRQLVAQIQARTIRREYVAVVQGRVVAGGQVNAPLGRHPLTRMKMAVVEDGRPATTFYQVARRFPAHTHLRLLLGTGRTHQIRVHMAHIGYPLVGDPVYGGRLRIPKAATPELAQTLRSFRRQALHAARLGLVHPASATPLSWECPLPADLAHLFQRLAEDAFARSQP